MFHAEASGTRIAGNTNSAMVLKARGQDAPRSDLLHPEIAWQSEWTRRIAPGCVLSSWAFSTMAEILYCLDTELHCFSVNI